MTPELITTSDGSHSLKSERFQVAYHSVHGAIQESNHVFLAAGLQLCVDRGLQEIKVLEMGFGTGLNAYLTLLFAEANPGISISYLTLEKYPIGKELVAQLNYPHELDQQNDDRLIALHAAEWGREMSFTDNFTFHKINGDLLDDTLVLPENWADTVFYDAFAPESQPDLWGEKALGKIVGAMATKGNLVTYCAKGVVKRQLKALGLQVEALPGPPFKREMTRGVKK